ncbi:effector binding domain-containing protein [Alkalicella caledoniensis]|uniref:Effector binding domain-containing protein n=2 Tax=Alkalicella caledoniensis TaxID=2731377 RepID=A0A7G9W671_ALKCA|nr:effector binding domain-containing protein [Alkalicella caledoniensis]
MTMMTISEVSRTFNVSTRTLRYYEQIGLLSSLRKEDYAYRMYDENVVRRLQQIIVLRKLRISLKEIAVILENIEYNSILSIFLENIQELDSEIVALSTIRDILKIFVSRLDKDLQENVKLDLLHDDDIIKVVDALSLSRTNFKEECSVEKLSKANETLRKLENVRIVLLPSCTVASYHYIGENPEDTVGAQINKFIQECKLYELKPDARMFGFNHPNPSKDNPYGYESWVTIPEDLEVPKPLTKKYFEGGLYGAHSIKFGDFHEWQLLCKWAENNEKYIPNYSELGEEIMGGCLEEHLNWVYSSHMGWPEDGIDGMLDLLVPIKLK